jgi:hypothetical protein
VRKAATCCWQTLKAQISGQTAGGADRGGTLQAAKGGEQMYRFCELVSLDVEANET